jgi:hypothetical protein
LGQWPMVGMNEATASMIGKAGHDYVEKNVSRYLPLPLLKTSFSVTNSYVLKKLRLLLFPWRHKSWSRRVSRRGAGGAGEGPGANGGQMMVEGWMAPREDINAPDLYIPSKSSASMFLSLSEDTRMYLLSLLTTTHLTSVYSYGAGHLYPTRGVRFWAPRGSRQ